MLSRITLLLLFLAASVTAFARDEWFRSLDLEPALNEASLVIAAQVLDVSETKMVFGGKMETTLREYKFAPVTILKGVYARDMLSMSSQDLGLFRSGEESPIERGQFRLLMLGRSRNGYAILRPDSRVEQSIPPLIGASDGLIESVKTLLAVSATTDRLERVHLLAAGLQARSGVAAVPLLVSMERRRLLAAQTPGVIDAISRQLRDSSPVVREQAAKTIRSLLESDYLDQAALRQTAVRTLVASLADQDPNIAFRVAALEAVGAAGRAALDPPGARTLLESVAPSSFAELGARFHAVGQLGFSSQRDAVLNTLLQMPLDAASEAQSGTEWAAVKLDPGKGVPDVTLRLKQKFAAGLPAVTEIRTLGDAPAALAVPALVDVSRQPLEHAERYVFAEACLKVPDNRLVAPLTALLAQNEPDVRQVAIQALFKIDTDTSATALQLYLASEPTLETKLEVAEFLGRHGIRDGYPYAIEHMSEAYLRERAIAALAAIRDPRSVGELRHILDTSNDVEWNTAAIEALGRLGAADLGLRFLAIARDARTPLAPAALIALGDLHDAAALPVIRTALVSRRPEMVVAGARAAGHLPASPADVCDQLAALLSDPAASIDGRAAALDSLLALQDPRLDEALRHADRDSVLEQDPEALLSRVEKLLAERKIRVVQ
jgi:HEAT repeat protein